MNEELICHLHNADFEIIREESGEAMGMAGEVESWIAISGRAQ